MSPEPRGPLLIVTLPGRSPLEVRRQVTEATQQGADAAEVRFDRWSTEDLARLGELFPSDLPLVATLRSRSEGGDGPDRPDDRAPWLAAVRASPFGWVDLELGRDPVTEGLSAEGPRPILSKHLPAGGPAEVLDDLLAVLPPSGGFLKVVVPASVRHAFEVVIPSVMARPARGDRSVMTVGPSGPLLRARATELGSCAVYCSLSAAYSGTSVEPSQIPAERYRRWLSAPPGSPLFAVVGAPIAHSRSPDLHDLWMREEQRAGLYVALEVDQGADLGSVAPALALAGFRGLSVTHPLKDAAHAIATRRTAAADRTGCANTLTLAGSEILADNTDLAAVQRRMTELRAGYPGILRHVVVVGSGGAARAALAAAQELGVRPEVVARNRARSDELARRYGADVGADPPAGSATLLIQATTVGRADVPAFEVPIEAWIDTRTHVLDFVYAPDHPTTAEIVRRRGGRYEDGRRLLAYAAAGSYAAWWGTPPSESLVEQALREVP
jgi:shikimate dehydrogenase